MSAGFGTAWSFCGTLSAADRFLQSRPGRPAWALHAFRGTISRMQTLLRCSGSGDADGMEVRGVSRSKCRQICSTTPSMRWTAGANAN